RTGRLHNDLRAHLHQRRRLPLALRRSTLRALRASHHAWYSSVPEVRLMGDRRLDVRCETLAGATRRRHCFAMDYSRDGATGKLGIIYQGQVSWEPDRPIEMCVPIAEKGRAHRIEP